MDNVVEITPLGKALTDIDSYFMNRRKSINWLQQGTLNYGGINIVGVHSHYIFLYDGIISQNTMKRRMNDYSKKHILGFKVYQKNYRLYVDFKGDTYIFKCGMCLVR